MSRPPLDHSFFLRGEGWPYLLVPFIPLAIVLDLANANEALIFATAALGIVPTAALMSRATEELASRSGPGVGGLLNVTFGNAPELIIALFALQKGLQEVVKASIIGSIISNILLVLGAAMLFGGLGRQQQTFSVSGASAQTSMLMLAAAGLMMPAVFVLVEGTGLPSPGAENFNYGSSVEHRVPCGRRSACADVPRRPRLLIANPPGRLQSRITTTSSRGAGRPGGPCSPWPAPAWRWP